MSAELDVTVESFGREHPEMDPALLVPHVRVALAKYHQSPANFDFHRGRDAACSAHVRFESPDPRSAATLEREDFVEKGAIVMAGVLLVVFEEKQITRVTKRGAKVDYFVGDRPGDIRWIMEVGGTDESSLTGLRRKKRMQFEQSPFRRAPHNKDGFVSATRFGPQAAAALDPIPGAPIPGA